MFMRGGRCITCQAWGRVKSTMGWVTLWCHACIPEACCVVVQGHVGVRHPNVGDKYRSSLVTDRCRMTDGRSQGVSTLLVRREFQRGDMCAFLSAPNIVPLRGKVALADKPH